eukprot:6462481-Amphidinium_carterae.1
MHVLASECDPLQAARCAHSNRPCEGLNPDRNEEGCRGDCWQFALIPISSGLLLAQLAIRSSRVEACCE